jgi:Flp pilus assembly protein CpaB
VAALLRPARELVGRQSRLRLGLLAAIFVAGFLALGPKPLRRARVLVAEGGEDQPVLVARNYIPAFRTIHDDLVEVRAFPREFVPPGALHGTGELQTERGQWLFSALVAIPQNQPVTRALLIERGKTNEMAFLLKPGKVAASFAVERARGAGGWVRPGDTVAIFETIGLGKPTRLLLSAVQVLAVDDKALGSSAAEEKEGVRKSPFEEMAAAASEFQVLTVLTTMSEAAALIEARERGPLSVVLRAMGDDLPWPGDPAYMGARSSSLKKWKGGTLE